MKTYIISFYQQEISDDELVSYLKAKREVLNLKSSLPNTVFVASDRNARSLSELIDKKFPEALYIVAEYVPYNSDGLLPMEMWNFLNKPRKARKANRTSSSKKRVAKSKSAPKRKQERKV